MMKDSAGSLGAATQERNPTTIPIEALHHPPTG